MGVFRFQKFSVLNDRAAMKVNTDGVLLGALMTLGPDQPHGVYPIQDDDRTQNEGMAQNNGRMHSDAGEMSEVSVRKNILKLLDIGTGTGTIALMAAQRLSEYGISFQIDAIDIDTGSAEEAGLNFAASPWKEHLRAFHTSLARFGARERAGEETREETMKETGEETAEETPERDGQLYDHIFSNPPFFTETLHSPDKRKAATRHSDSLPLEEITAYASSHLEPDGRLSLILPFEQIASATRIAAESNLNLYRIVEIHSSDRKPPYRAELEFSPRKAEDGVLKDRLTINSRGEYTHEYLSLISPYLLLGR